MQTKTHTSLLLSYATGPDGLVNGFGVLSTLQSQDGGGGGCKRCKLRHAQCLLLSYATWPQMVSELVWFGVGFYSAFMVGDKVEVFTKTHEPDAQARHWTSDGWVCWFEVLGWDLLFIHRRGGGKRCKPRHTQVSCTCLQLGLLIDELITQVIISIELDIQPSEDNDHSNEWRVIISNWRWIQIN